MLLYDCLPKMTGHGETKIVTLIHFVTDKHLSFFKESRDKKNDRYGVNSLRDKMFPTSSKYTN